VGEGGLGTKANALTVCIFLKSCWPVYGFLIIHRINSDNFPKKTSAILMELGTEKPTNKKKPK
jgi:hypothetical protein